VGVFEGNGLVDLDAAAATGVAAAAGVLSTVASIPAGVLSDDALADATLVLEQARRFLDAAELACLGELERRGVTEARFGQRPTAWLAHEAKLPRAVAAARVRTARKVTGELAAVGDAMRDGVIGFEHARVLADAANPRNAGELGSVVGELVDAAQVASFQRWAGEVRGLADLLDADGGHDPNGDLPEPRLSLHRVGDVTTVSGQLSGDGAHTAATALEQMADELFRRHTRDAALTGQPVPARSQLVAEAFVELCRRGLAVDTTTARPPRVEATVVINAAEPDAVFDTHGALVADPSVLLCDVALWPIVTTFDSVPLAAGRAHRFATPHQVRAVNLRDGGCVFPGCDTPASWTDTHHADVWGGGGHSDTDRMCGLCRHHHRLAHHPDWQLHLDPDGWTRWTRPDGHTIWGQRHQRQRHGPARNNPAPDT
jgi:hypothetical protein